MMFAFNSGVFNRIFEWATESPALSTAHLFKSSIYGILLLNTIFLIPLAEDLWGTDSLILPFEYPDSLLYQLYFFLMSDWGAQWYGVVMAIQVLAIVFWFLGVWQTMMRVIICIATVMLFTRAHLYTTGGHTLMNLLVFYLIFIPERPQSVFENAMTNLFLLACKIQIATMYGFAALFKFHGTYWLNGEALYYVLSIREFSHPWLQSILLDHPVVLKLGTWFGLDYQSLFPILVWFRKIKTPLLWCGVFFHLFIGFGLGLPDFGLFMVCAYTVFSSDHVAQSWIRRLHLKPYFAQRG